MNQVAELSRLSVGDEIPAHDAGPITRWVLAMFAGGSGDPNPMHIDSDFAKMVGREDVFAHGMLSMAYLAQLLTNWVPQDRIRSFGVRFASITPVNTSVKCTGKVVEKFVADGEPRLRLELLATVDDGTVTLTGEAVVAV